jgi:hypothetical protein
MARLVLAESRAVVRLVSSEWAVVMASSVLFRSLMKRLRDDLSAFFAPDPVQKAPA